jgi:membrane fusion protein (multidrug efflux system)/multidrug efflux system membrane fusion protein
MQRASLSRDIPQAFSLLALHLVALGSAAACSSSGATEQQPARREMRFPVAVSRITPAAVDYKVAAVGSIAAFEHIQITARVGGAVERVGFREGDVVKTGQLLAEIEPRRYQLALASALAGLQRAEVARLEAARERDRAQKLHAEGVGTSSDVAAWETKLAASSADEAQAKANVEMARLNARDARVAAPVSGTIETRAVETGQYVQPGAVLGTLIQRDPLLLRFNVAERDASALRLGMTVQLAVKGADAIPHAAKITHIGGAANEKSRMVPVVAEVTSEPQSLRPGAFAEVTVPIGASREALAVPETAIRPSERGFLAYVVDGDTAKERRLELGLRTPEGRVEVRAGLSAGELLVIRGGEALKDGVKVRVAELDGKSPPAGPRPASSR